MANAFKNKTQREVGTALTAIGSYTVGGSTETTVIGLTIANTTTVAIEVDATLNDGTNDFYIVKNINFFSKKIKTVFKLLSGRFVLRWSTF